MLRSAVIAGLAAVALATGLAVAQDVTLPALGIALEGYAYPYPVQYFTVVNDGRSLSMAYMDVAPAANANGRTVVLMHGKNFGGYYFRNVIARLSAAGYRVIVPDQIGWGKSPKPDIHYSFQQLAANTSALLDSLRVGNVAVLGHSTGGMLAVRFALMYPQRVTQLILEDPVGLEDYRLKIPSLRRSKRSTRTTSRIRHRRFTNRSPTSRFAYRAVLTTSSGHARRHLPIK
jgi:pimeloyl-ACP methyl ester carboxylesterase